MTPGVPAEPPAVSIREARPERDWEFEPGEWLWAYQLRF